MQRKTYALVNKKILENNVKDIINKYNNYEYYFGVVKNNAYHHGFEVVKDLINGGINYLAVATLEEALEVRKFENETKILILEPIHIEYVNDAIVNNITLTIESLEYVKELVKLNLVGNLNIHIKIDSGMHRLGFYKKEYLDEAYKLLQKNPKITIEGIYTHFATSGTYDIYYDKQVDTFIKLTSDIDLKNIPIVHLGRSLSLVNHDKLEFANGIRLGIVMYGLSQSIPKDTSIKGLLKETKRNRFIKKNNLSKTYLENNLNLKTALSLYSEVISIRPITAGDIVGYGVNKIDDNGYILTIPIGYADGVSSAFNKVCINNQLYPIISNTMDMIMVFSKEKIKLGSKVEIFGDKISIKEASKETNQNAYHLFNTITYRVPIVYDEKDI